MEWLTSLPWRIAPYPQPYFRKQNRRCLSFVFPSYNSWNLYSSKTSFQTLPSPIALPLKNIRQKLSACTLICLLSTLAYTFFPLTPYHNSQDNVRESPLSAPCQAYGTRPQSVPPATSLTMYEYLFRPKLAEKNKFYSHPIPRNMQDASFFPRLPKQHRIFRKMLRKILHRLISSGIIKAERS